MLHLSCAAVLHLIRSSTNCKEQLRQVTKALRRKGSSQKLKENLAWMTSRVSPTDSGQDGRGDGENTPHQSRRLDKNRRRKKEVSDHGPNSSLFIARPSTGSISRLEDTRSGDTMLRRCTLFRSNLLECHALLLWRTQTKCALSNTWHSTRDIQEIPHLVGHIPHALIQMKVHHITMG